MRRYDLEALQTKPFLTPEEGAAYVGIGRSSMYKHIRNGDVPMLRLGRLIRIPREGLEALVIDSRDLATLGPPVVAASSDGVA